MGTEGRKAYLIIKEMFGGKGTSESLDFCLIPGDNGIEGLFFTLDEFNKFLDHRDIESDTRAAAKLKERFDHIVCSEVNDAAMPDYVVVRLCKTLFDIEIDSANTCLATIKAEARREALEEAAKIEWEREGCEYGADCFAGKTCECSDCNVQKLRALQSIEREPTDDQ